MNEAYKRLTHRTLNAAKRRKSNGAKLNSSLKGRKTSSVNCAAYERYTYKTKRPALGVKTAEEIRAILSAYISISVLITNVTNIGGDIMVNYRILDDNIDRELAQNEIIAGLDYIEAITDTMDYSTLNSAAMSASEAKDKYKELLHQCYIAVYEHSLDVNDPQVTEYRNQMNKLTEQFGDIANTMDAYIASLDKKYNNTIDFTKATLDSAKAVVDRSTRDVADYAADSYKEYKLINRDFKQPVAVSFSVVESTNEYSGYVIALDKDRNYILENIEGVIPEGVDPVQEVLNDYSSITGTATFDECDENSFNTKARAIRELADAEKTVRETNERIAHAEEFKEENGVYPDEWDPLTALFNSEIEGLGD